MENIQHKCQSKDWLLFLDKQTTLWHFICPDTTESWFVIFGAKGEKVEQTIGLHTPLYNAITHALDT